MILTCLLVFAGLVGEVVLDSQVTEPSTVGALDPSHDGLIGEEVQEPQEPEPLIFGTYDQRYPDALFANKCIEDLGCFYTGPPFWHPLYRPISLPPSDKIRTRFHLFTRSNADKPSLLNLTKEGVMDPNFDAGSATKFLIHGYSVTLKPDDVRFTMVEELLREGPYNVIIVNWTDSNQSPYWQAVANGRVVGAQIAKLTNLLMENRGLKLESVHIIGHSLGGQVSGWAGERLPGLSRITGLDPAGPFFQKAPSEVRLDPTDADFVDVIHSNGGDYYVEGYGIKDAIGHYDFYPNGGNSQPGCFYHQNMTYKMTDEEPNNYVANSCDHSRANHLFVDSINKCHFLAVDCESIRSFERGECDNATNVSVMGLRAQKSPDLEGPRKFYLYTDDESPFCEEE